MGLGILVFHAPNYFYELIKKNLGRTSRKEKNKQLNMKLLHRVIDNEIVCIEICHGLHFSMLCGLLAFLQNF